MTPSDPPVRVDPVQAKPLRVLVLPMLLPPVPGVMAVTVTVLALDEPVTFAPEQALIAAARFEARVAVVELVANVALANVGHVFVPSMPLMAAAHEKMPVSFDAPEMVLPGLPGVLEVIVVVLLLDPAVTPAVAGQRLIAAERFEASVVGLELVA